MLLAVENGDILQVTATTMTLEDLSTREGHFTTHPYWFEVGGLRFWHDRERGQHLVHRPSDGQIFIRQTKSAPPALEWR